MSRFAVDGGRGSAQSASRQGKAHAGGLSRCRLPFERGARFAVTKTRRKALPPC